MAYNKYDNAFIEYVDYSLLVEMIIVGLFIFLIMLILLLET
jgi:hypothetical protein